MPAPTDTTLGELIAESSRAPTARVRRLAWPRVSPACLLGLALAGCSLNGQPDEPQRSAPAFDPGATLTPTATDPATGSPINGGMDGIVDPMVPGDPTGGLGAGGAASNTPPVPGAAAGAGGELAGAGGEPADVEPDAGILGQQLDRDAGMNEP